MKLERTQVLLLAVATSLIGLMVCPSAARADVIKSTMEWTGELEDEKLVKEIPTDGVITNKEDLAKLWKAWMRKDKMPEIDFDKEFVVVTTSTKGKVVNLHLIDEKGKSQAAVGFTPKEIKGFTYAIATFKREGIKSLDGKPLKK